MIEDPRMMPLLAPAPWHIGSVTTRDAAPGLCRAGAGFMIEVVGLGTPLCQRLGMERPAFARAGVAAGPDLVAAVPNAGRSGGARAWPAPARGGPAAVVLFWGDPALCRGGATGRGAVLVQVGSAEEAGGAATGSASTRSSRRF